MTETYSTYEAKAKLSEILRKVEEGRTVVISRHGRAIAEIRPVETAPVTVEQRLKDLTERGVVTRPGIPDGRLRPVARRPGALERFLRDRNE